MILLFATTLIHNETDRTIVALLVHENIIDMFSKFEHKEVIDFYLNVLDNMCFADFIDRITFQKQHGNLMKCLH